MQTLTPDGQKAVARFTDIVIHDGSSFALKAALSGTFPGRFTTIEPAAVEIHATSSTTLSPSERGIPAKAVEPV